MNRSITVVILIAIVAVILLFASAFIVRETERVVITQFGEVVRLEEEPGLSFKVPFIQEVKRLDKRWLEWDGDANQITTLDKRYIYIDAFARWRIGDPMVFIQTLRDERSAQGRLDDIIDNATRNVIANHKLIEVIRSTNRSFEHDAEEAALSMREEEIFNEQGDAVTSGAEDAEETGDPSKAPEGGEASASEEAPDEPSKEDATTEPEGEEAAENAEGDTGTPPETGDEKPATPEPEAEKAKPAAEEFRAAGGEGEGADGRRNLYAIDEGRDKLTRMVLEKASSKAAQLGIEIKDVQIKRINYIESVQAKVFDRMISERKRVAEAYRSEGQGRSAEIIGKMEMELQQIQSEAYKESQRIMGRADADAAEIYAKAYKKNPDFYQFTKTMESYQHTIDDESWLLLSTESDFGRYLKSIKGKRAGD
jgi:regulator of protease activity HflC (stomatin/prohibitin superfamily)